MFESYLGSPKTAKQISDIIELALADDFRTIDWPKEYPAPELTLGQIKELLA